MCLPSVEELRRGLMVGKRLGNALTEIGPNAAASTRRRLMTTVILTLMESLSLS
jgi:hypothetical protein